LLAVGGRGWIAPIDINPLVMTRQGRIAVDGLRLVRSAVEG
jgi:hypothetical protein